MESFLKNAEDAGEELLIIYFIPWQDCEGYKKLSQSLYKINELLLLNNNGPPLMSRKPFK